MSCSRALKLSVLLLLLPLTLGWKLAVKPGAALGEPDTLRRVADFLVRQRFSVTVAEKVEEGQPSLLARAGPCRMLIALSPPTASDRDLVRRHASPGDQVFVVFRGRVYAEKPTWLTVSDFLWARFRRELGVTVRAAPIFAVVASPGCDAERLPWGEVA